MADATRAYRGSVYTSEIGKTGLRQQAGYPTEEFLTMLTGMQGIRTYREMSDNDPIIGGLMFAIKQILRELRWSVKGGTEEDQQFLKTNMNMLNPSWMNFIIEVSSMFIYGWAIFEQVYQRKEGKIFWKKFAFRSQTSLERWEILDTGETLGIWQRPAPTYDLIYLPMTKCLHFRPDHFAENPEGRSILRNAYRPFFMKKNIEEIEAIGIERDLVGIPSLTMPEGMKVDDDNVETAVAISWAKKILMNIRNDEQAGLLLPFGWVFELVASPGAKTFDTSAVIKRYSTEIAVTVLAQFIMLGMDRTGSYALSKNITDMFYLCIEGWADIIASTINSQAVSLLFALNGNAPEEMPQIVHTAVRKEGLKDIVAYIAGLVSSEAIDIDDELKSYLRKYARLEDFSEARR
jgi:hypothetical protein